MINNVQFTGNPINKGIKVATNAMESFAESRKNIPSPISLVNSQLDDAARESAAMSKKPILKSAMNNEAKVSVADNTMAERENSYAISHGIPEAVVSGKKIDYLA